MAKLNIDVLKTSFESGDRPSGQDYANLIDTLAGATDLGSAGNNDQTVNGIENITVLDSFNANEWRLVKYMVSLSKTIDGANKFYATEFSILIDKENINVSEYGVIDNDGDMGTVTVSKDNGLIKLTINPNPAVRPVTARFARVGLKA